MGSRDYLDKLIHLPTPFYFYDVELLRETLRTATREASRYGYKLHYALKANFHDRILAEMRAFGLGADCVSGGEMRKAIESGIPPSEVVFAGVAKSDDEIRYGLEHDIFSFNCESRQELQVIDSIAADLGRSARVALRINPDVDPHTHRNIATGVSDSKFGISYQEVDRVIAELAELPNVEIVGLHFHIGSQITDMEVFEKLCVRANTIRRWFEQRGLTIAHLNMGGGLGIDYSDPEHNSIPDFARYFAVFHRNLEVTPAQTVHFEPGRSLVGQCGELLTRVLYTKTAPSGERIALVDAGMTQLMRPMLYQAAHRIENLTSHGARHDYMIAGPICESTDLLARGVSLPETSRGDLLRVMSAGAYGRSMASNYNLREFSHEIFSDEV